MSNFFHFLDKIKRWRIVKFNLNTLIIKKSDNGSGKYESLDIAWAICYMRDWLNKNDVTVKRIHIALSPLDTSYIIINGNKSDLDKTYDLLLKSDLTPYVLICDIS